MKDNLQSSLDSLRQQLEDANEQLQENQNLLSAESHKCLDLEQRLSLAKLNEEHLERRISQFERNEQIRNMAAIKDKEMGEERHLTKDEKERIMANREEARRRRLRKLSISESKETTEKVRQDFQVGTVVTQDHNHIQEQVVGQAEPQQYS